MRNSSFLTAIFPKTRQDILSTLLMRPTKSWYASELAQTLGVAPSNLQRELLNLTDAGILKTYKQGRFIYFQANVESPIFIDLRNIFAKTSGLVETLADALSDLRTDIQCAFVYGSVANATEQADSDVDLIVIGMVKPRQLALPLRKAQDLLHRTVNATCYTPSEFSRKQEAKDHFLTRVLEKPKAFVFGNTNELG